MDGKVDELKDGGKAELSQENEQNGEVKHAEEEDTKNSKQKDVNREHADSNSQSRGGKAQNFESIRQSKEGKVEDAETTSIQKDTKVERAGSINQSGGGKSENSESTQQSKGVKVENAESIKQSKDGKVESAESVRPPIAEKVKVERIQRAKYLPKRKKKSNESKTSGGAKLKGKFMSFGETIKKLWGVWSNFKTKNIQNPNPSISEKTLGVPGFEEIACIEAEVPDIMMMDKDRVRTSCKECMKDPPAFPTMEQIKAKLIAADKYYGVKTAKANREPADTTLEHEADYYDNDGSVVRPSWRFILERPLVEQYVLMTNYIRKVSVLSELKDNKSSKKFIEEEDSGSDTEYKKFEQKFIKEKRELLKPIQKPKTQDMAVQTSPEPKQDNSEYLKESLSEISLYPESEESKNSPDTSAMTVVTSRDYTSPLQSDFDGRTTERSTSYRGENWWESQATCEPSESFQTSYDSINKNTSSGSDGQSVPIHSVWGKTTLQRAKEGFSNESGSRITPHGRSVEPSTHKQPKASRKVSFSPVVTYYQGPNKNAALYNLPGDQEIATETKVAAQQQGTETGTPPENHETVNPAQDQITITPTEKKITDNATEDQITEERPMNEEEVLNDVATKRCKPSNRKVSLRNILQDKKRGQIVSVSLPEDWHEDRILCNKKTIKVAVSRNPPANHPVTKKLSFREYEEIPDVEYSDPHVSTVQDRSGASIQTQTSGAQESALVENFKPIKHNPRQSKIHPTDDSPTAQLHNSRSPDTQRTLGSKIPNDAFNLSLGYEGTESIATETNIQTAPARSKAGARSETPITVEQRYDDHRTGPVMPDQAITSDATAQQVSSPRTDAKPSWVYTHTPPTEKNPHPQPHVEGTPRNAKHVHVAPNSNPDQKLIDRINKLPHNPPLIRDKSHSQQQHSTDTDGPSSSSNEHIKLKASPPCFFKVATPTDLSKISVDEFYPDVPEIDAELSQTSETKTPSAPQVNIVFPNKETALRYIQDAEFHRITRKEENTITQNSIKTTEIECQVTQKAPNKGKTIIAYAGIGIKIDEGTTETSKDKGQDKSSNFLMGKAPTKNSSQHSNITQTVWKSGLFSKQSQIESEEEEAQAETSKKDLRDTAMKRGTIRDHEVKRNVKLEKDKPTDAQVKKENQISAQQLPAKKEIPSIKRLKTLVTTESTSHVPTPPGRSIHLLSGCSKKGKETVTYNALEGTEISEVQGEIVNGDETEKHEQLVNNEYVDKLTKIQSDSLPVDLVERLMPQGRTKLYMRTLSSLVEETSSVVEATRSSTPEKLIDMPATAWPVEELKAIFEKPEAASVSGKSGMLAKESGSDPKKCAGLSKEKLDDRASGRLVPVELITPSDDANETTESHLRHESDEKTTNTRKGERQNSQGNLPPALVKLDVSNATDSTTAKNGSVKANELVKFENSQCGIDKNTHTSAMIQEEPSIQLSQIDVIRASEIYSNTSIYFSSSEDRAAKLTKARTGFQPVTLNDLASSGSSRDMLRASNENSGGPNKRHLGSSKNSSSKEKFPQMANSVSQINNDSKTKQRGMLKTDQEGDGFSVGQAMQQIPSDARRKSGKENGETEVAPTNAQESSSKSATGMEKLEANQPTDPIPKAKPGIDDTSNPSENKHWLMDAIPVLPKTRFHGFRPHKPICVKEATDAEVVKYRQDAVKPVFRFLKRQREMKENRE